MESLARELELERELQARLQERKTVYGIYRPTDTFGGELLYCLQEQDGKYVEVDLPPSVSLAEKMAPFLTKEKRFKLAFGGRGSTKSVAFASILAAHSKDYGDKTLCLREMQNTIEDSVHALLADQIRGHGWTNFDITDKAIKLGDTDAFKFRGMARNVDGVKSAFGFKRSWGEEAQAFSLKSLDALTPTIREVGSELWFSFNPGSSADPMSERFLMPFYKQLLRDGYYEDDLHLIVWINYTDNPWHGVLEDERLFDKKNKSKAAYDHKWLGYFNDEVSNAIIPAEHFDAAIDAHKKLGFKPEGAVVASHDPSDTGPDDKGYCLRHGSVVLDVDFMEDGDVNEGCDWAIDKAIQANADWFTWDCDGMGISLKRQVADSLSGKHIDYVMFRGSEKPEHPESEYLPTDDSKRKTNKDTFYNKRAQYYIRLRDRFAKTYKAVEKGEYIDPDELISLSSDIKCMSQLRSELCRIPSKPNGAGKIQILSKDEMAKKPYELPSPNLADAVMMSMMLPESKAAPKKIKFKGWNG